ncbi:MAG: SAM-dependent methyltransferase, partial [Usitatibacteraceae bacterium]
AALAASAQLGISMTKRGVARSVTFATPRIGPGEPDSEWLASAAAAESTVLYMAAGQASQIASALIASGKPAATPVAIVENATLENERRIFTSLGGLTASALNLDGPAVLCIGDVFAPPAVVMERESPQTDVALRKFGVAQLHIGEYTKV